MEEIEKDCLDFIKRMLSGELTLDQKYLGFMELDKKYPGIGFYNSGQKFAHKWIKQDRKERLPYKEDE